MPVHYLLELWEKGYDVKEIHEQYPTVPTQLIRDIVKILSKNQILKVAG